MGGTDVGKTDFRAAILLYRPSAAEMKLQNKQPEV